VAGRALLEVNRQGGADRGQVSFPGDLVLGQLEAVVLGDGREGRRPTPGAALADEGDAGDVRARAVARDLLAKLLGRRAAADRQPCRKEGTPKLSPRRQRVYAISINM
jgi:hypothetical protein